MTIYSNSSRRIRNAALRVDEALRPDWILATKRLPAVGEEILCAEGLATVIRLLGKTGDGSRLLELALPDRPPRLTFFAAASNVLVAPA